MQDDINVIFIDWEKGAAGPSYAVAAANTQLIGRQLALLLMDIITLSTKPESIHIVGFSLGAHIAGFAGRAIQQRGFKIGRITGKSNLILWFSYNTEYWITGLLEINA